MNTNIYALIVALSAGFGAGYIYGTKHTGDKFVSWYKAQQGKNKLYKWEPDRPGNYPPIVIIEKTIREVK